MNLIRTISFGFIVFSLLSCSAEATKDAGIESKDNGIFVESTPDKNPSKKKHQDLSKYQTAYFASGCFWCVEAVFESVKGVQEVVSGYAGGTEQNPTYQQVSAGKTGHAESVKVYYDPAVIDYKTLVTVYYGSQNPTTENGQYPDFGSQYRSIIFYQTDDERQIVDAYINQLEQSGKYDKPIATEVVKFKKFWEAEDYHQDYVLNNPKQGYVQRISIPRAKEFQQEYPELIKPDRRFK